MLPIAAFAAAIYVANRLSSESELLVVQATGISPYRIVKFGADDDHVIQGAAATDSLIGVIDQPRVAAAAEERVDVIHNGIADVEFGGTITRGGLVTSDTTGRAVAAAPGAGTNNDVIGRALMSGVIGDIGKVLIDPGRIQG